MTAVVSFDVFDTVLTRLVGRPDDVFTHVGHRLRAEGVISIDAAAYAAARAQAMQDLTPDTAVHPTLDAVCAEAASRLGLADGAARSLAAAELEVEEDLCRAVPGAVKRVAAGRARTGRGAVFVSDTPLPAGFLEKLLRREELFLDGDELFTSADLGASKQQGGLFDLVAQRLGVPAAQIEHVGDDRWSDLAHARLHGWTAAYDTAATLTSRERELARAGATTSGLGGRFAGAARMARLAAADAEPAVSPGVAGIAGAVAGPLLAAFGLWTLRQAQLQQLDRLYFIARDGEVFRDVTSRLARNVGSEVECRYLYGSRRSWQLAAMGTATHRGQDELWLPDGIAGSELSARAALALVDLDVENARALVSDPAFAPGRCDAPLGVDGWHRVRGLLTAGALSEQARQRSMTRKDLLVRYLDQEGVTGPGRVGFVDVGWTGRAARSLEDVLLDAGRPVPAAHLFLGLLDAAPTLMGPDLHARSRGWLIDESRGRRSRAGDEDPVMLIESFAMGSEGNTLGLELVGDEVAPVLRSARNPAVDHWDFAGYRTSLAAALEALCDGPALETGVDLRPLAWTQLLAFWHRPEPAEAQAWGAQPYSEDFANAELHPLATPVTGRRMLARLRIGPAQWRQPTYWLSGTIALSPPLWRRVLSAVVTAQAFSARARRVPARLRAEFVLRRGGR